mgnify:CR=1 FL=1
MGTDGVVAPAGARTLSMTFGTLMVCTLTLTLGNKYILRAWEYESMLLVMQSCATVVIIVGCNAARGCGGPEWLPSVQPLTLRHFKLYAGTSFFLTLQLITSLYGLPLVTIATVTVFQNLRTLCTALFEALVLGESFSREVVVALLVTVVGSVVYGISDYREGGNYDPAGYLWLGANVVASVVAALAYRHFNPSVKQTGWGIALLENVNMMPIFLVMAWRLDGGWRDALVAAPRSVWVCIAMTSIAGAIIGSAYANCYKYAAATSVAVAATINKCIAILFGLVLFKKSLSVAQWMALAVIVSGGVWFARSRRKQQHEQAKEALRREADAFAGVELGGQGQAGQGGVVVTPALG